jgi:glutamine amidotransferase
MIAIINYGLGNLHSVYKAVAYVGGEAEVTEDEATIIQADKIILPGVGADIKVPQIGWNQVEVKKPSSPLKDINNGDYFYFNHSYYCVPEDPEVVLTMTNYGVPFASAVENGNLYGVQFHPEKSQKVGLKILKNFVEI